MTDLLVSISGGLIKNESQARIVLVVISLAFIGLTIYILLSSFRPAATPRSSVPPEDFVPAKEQDF